MNVSLYQAASALQANNRWQELIGENLASGSMPGFKRQDISFSSVAAGLLPQGVAGRADAAKNFELPKATGITNFTPGELNVTGENTDVALEGPGFFQIQLPSGAFAYTRNGSFTVNSQGQLVTKAGYLVMGDTGPIQIDPRNTNPLSFSADGEVKQGAEVKGKLKLVDFDDPTLLSVTGGSYFLATNPDLVPRPVTDGTVRQGFLEASNTSSLLEMSNLITAMRAYEANQRVIQMHDERMSRSINELGSPATS